MTKLITLRFENPLNSTSSDLSSPGSKEVRSGNRSVPSADTAQASELSVTMTVSTEQGAPYLQTQGRLPLYTPLLTHYQTWNKSYRALEKQTRAIKAKAARVDRSIAALRQECQQLSHRLQHDLDVWLSCPSFHAVCRELYRELALADEDIRLLIQADDLQIWRLPWHLWKELEQHPDLEIGFSKTQYSRVFPIQPASGSTVQILAVFGDSQGINTQVDRAELLALPQAEVKVLNQPSRQAFSDQLWSQAWDILFFAGHSRTAHTSGYLQLNATDSLPLGDLKKSLQHSVRQGLQLAIFNSCDGLGLAWELDSLQIPQLVLMRELVPDAVAHQFLQNFLTGFSQGKTLYTSVRQARDRLESLERDFPCATWLPVICQNPAAPPPTWHSLQYQSITTSEQPNNPEQPDHSEQSKHQLKDASTTTEAHTRKTGPQHRPHARSWYQKLNLAMGLGAGIAGAVLGLRWMGVLEFFELKAHDAMVRLTPVHPSYDPNLLIIEITEADLEHPAQAQRLDSLSPVALNQLLTILNRAEAAVIGLDIYRDRPYQMPASALATSTSFEPPQTLPDSSSTHPENLSHWASTDSPLITICRIKDASASLPEVKPPQNFPIESVGFSDAVTDSDGVMRRALLAMKPESGQCMPGYSLPVQLALRYLHPQGIELQWHGTQEAQLGEARLISLEARPGAYLHADRRGFQIPLRYRTVQGAFPFSLSQSFERVSLTQVLNGAVPKQTFQNRIILIGTTAKSYKDYHATPFGQTLPGVVLQAHMTRQLIDAALGKQALLRNLPTWGDALWIGLWSMSGGLIGLVLPGFKATQATPFKTYVWVPISGIAMIGSLSFLAFVGLNLWLPVIPSMSAAALAYLCATERFA